MDVETFEPFKPDGTVTVLQLSDCHLFAGNRGELLGINTRDSFAAVLEAVMAQQRQYDFVAVTGDISQDYSAESYKVFASMIKVLGAKVFFLPGNHDDGPLMYRMLGDMGVYTAKRMICGKWQFLFLNSEVYGMAHGWAQRQDLEYVCHCARERGDLFTAVCIHHLPLMVGSYWLDTQTLHNQNEFAAFVNPMPQIRLVLSGHVHQEVDTMADHIRYIASPSTSIQFAPHSESFEIDGCRGPGWRWLYLHTDGTLDTEVCRLPPDRFKVNMVVEGY